MGCGMQRSRDDISQSGRHATVIAAALLVLAAFAVRIVLAWFSTGTNDAGTWLRFANRITSHGLFNAYFSLPSLNHPPLPALWSAAALKLSQASDVHFEFIFKLPAILADASACVILYLIFAQRHGRRAGWIAAAAYACNPVAILVGAYHCNTDNIYAMFCLLAAWFIARGRPLTSGLSLAAAINVKLIPVLLVPALLSMCRTRREAVRFILGLSIGVIPFIPLLIAVGPQFARNALAYNSLANRWGIGFFLYEMYHQPPFRTFAYEAMRFYFENGRWFILAAVALVSFFSFRRRAWDAYEVGAIALAIFLILAPGFGLQYTVAIAPLLLAASLAAGALYGLLAGLLLAFAYVATWTGNVPLASFFDGPWPMPGPLFGLLAWWVLIVYVIRVLRRAGSKR
jgi:Gpi18-like mannosyltransferase